MGKAWGVIRKVVWLGTVLAFLYNMVRLEIIPVDRFQQTMIWGIILLWFESGEKK